MIERIVGLAERLTPIALIGAGGIGKTSTVLTVLHDDRIKQRFGDNRRFIRCDGFPTSDTHFLRRLSEVIGAGIENPKDLTPLRRHLSSKEMFIALDNAESVLDPQGSSAQEIYTVVDELIRFSNICLCITSRISTIPPDCETLEIPTLSMEAAHATFYRIYKHGKQSDPINNILEQLDFHPLSITLLATVAQYNKWDTKRLTVEWGRQRTGVLHAQHSRSLATTITLSLASPMFRELGPDAQEVLRVIAFFPQGVNENNIDWLFPAISGGPNMFDKFCILSLTYRSNGFVTMLAPLRDYLRPKDPTSSQLLRAIKERYFARLPPHIYPDDPSFKESRWITSEDVNVEYLLDAFTSIDGDSIVWDACAEFMKHLYWHKPRLIILGPKIEALPDNHPSKAQCLEDLSWLFKSAGNWAENKRLLTHTLKLWRKQGDDYRTAKILGYLSDANRLIGLHKEGIQQAREASEIFERLGDAVTQAYCLIDLASLLCSDEQLDAAEEAASRAINLLLPEKGEQLRVSQGHRVLGTIYRSRGQTGKAIHHFKVALGIASSLNWHNELFRVLFALAQLFIDEGRFSDAHAHVERAKSHAANDPYLLARASWLKAGLWDKQCMFKEARSEALRALDVFEELGAASDVVETRELLKQIGYNARGTDSDLVALGGLDDEGKLLETAQVIVLVINSSCSESITKHE